MKYEGRCTYKDNRAGTVAFPYGASSIFGIFTADDMPLKSFHVADIEVNPERSPLQKGQ